MSFNFLCLAGTLLTQVFSKAPTGFGNHPCWLAVVKHAKTCGRLFSYAQPSIGAATLTNFKPQSSSQLELLPPKLSPHSCRGVVGNERGVGVRDKGCNKKTRWCGLHITPHVSAILQQVCAHTVHVLRRQNAALSIHVPCHFGWRTFVVVVGRTGGGANVHH